jgi:hypothetical protein
MFVPKPPLARKRVAVFSLALAVACLITPGTALAGNAVRVFTPVADANVTSARPRANFGHALRLRVDAAPLVRSYLRFDIKGLSSGVARVKLRIFVNSGTRRGFRVFRVKQRWHERALTFTNAPPLADAVGVVAGPLRARTWTTVDVTRLVRGNGSYNIALVTRSSVAISMSSREVRRRRAKLVVETAPSHAEPAWGLAGGYSGIDMESVRRQGIGLVLVSSSWARAEPIEGTFDEQYFASLRDELARRRAQGFDVIFEVGFHRAPAWLLAKADARFVNQFGEVYTDSPEPNLIFARKYRPFAEHYAAKLFSEVGTDFTAVRVGGGHYGELQYPAVFDPARGKPQNDYWAFDAEARKANPVPAWHPCQPAARGEAAIFLAWYLNSLSMFQNWQVETVRRHYAGTIAVLYASWGMRAGDFEAAVRTSLCGTSSAEVNGEVQRAYDHAGHIAALTDPNVAVWGTWAENGGTISWLSSLADAHGLKMMGENSGEDDLAKMTIAIDAARSYGLSAFLWVRASQAFCFCGYATIDDYTALISADSS